MFKETCSPVVCKTVPQQYFTCLSCSPGQNAVWKQWPCQLSLHTYYNIITDAVEAYLTLVGANSSNLTPFLLTVNWWPLTQDHNYFFCLDCKLMTTNPRSHLFCLDCKLMTPNPRSDLFCFDCKLMTCTNPRSDLFYLDWCKLMTTTPRFLFFPPDCKL